MAEAPQPGLAEFEEGSKLYQAKDFTGALRWLRKSAELGNTQAQIAVVYQYEFGEGVAKDYKEAVRWYTRAAQAGDPHGQRNLGSMYENGQGVPEDWIEAAKWYRKSAEQHYVKGQFALGRMYQFGMGVPQNRQETIMWYRKAADQGDGEAAYFAEHLRTPRNSVGFRTAQEQAFVGITHMALNFNEPVGQVFRNSAERNAYLTGIRQSLNYQDQKLLYDIQAREYADCVRAQKPDCLRPVHRRNRERQPAHCAAVGLGNRTFFLHDGHDPAPEATQIIA